MRLFRVVDDPAAIDADGKLAFECFLGGAHVDPFIFRALKSDHSLNTSNVINHLEKKHNAPIKKEIWLNLAMADDTEREIVKKATEEKWSIATLVKPPVAVPTRLRTKILNALWEETETARREKDRA